MPAKLPLDAEGRKRCSTCRLYKSLDQYVKSRGRSDGLSNVCRACAAESGRRWQKNVAAHRCVSALDRDDPLFATKRCSKCGLTKYLWQFVPDRRKPTGVTASCVACRNAFSRRDRAEHPERRRKYYDVENSRRWFAANREWSHVVARRSRLKRRDKIAAAERRRRRENPHHKVLSNLRGRFNDALRAGRAAKRESICKLLGCTVAEAMDHLARQFEPGMSWENYGKGEGRWHLDHIRPCCTFDLTDYAQQQECFHYTNLRPAWGRDNLMKAASDKAQSIHRARWLPTRTSS